MPPAIVLKRRIGLGVDVPLNRRKLGQFAGANFFKSAAEIINHVRDLRQQMNRGIVLAAVFRETGEGGKTIQSQINLHGRASATEVVEFGIEVARKVVWADQRARAKRIG